MSPNKEYLLNFNHSSKFLDSTDFLFGDRSECQIESDKRRLPKFYIPCIHKAGSPSPSLWALSFLHFGALVWALWTSTSYFWYNCWHDINGWRVFTGTNLRGIFTWPNQYIFFGHVQSLMFVGVTFGHVQTLRLVWVKIFSQNLTEIQSSWFRHVS